MDKELEFWIENARRKAHEKDGMSTSSYLWQDALEGRCLPNPDVYLERDRRMQYDG